MQSGRVFAKPEFERFFKKAYKIRAGLQKEGAVCSKDTGKQRQKLDAGDRLHTLPWRDVHMIIVSPSR